jgi:hypothetical protein
MPARRSYEKGIKVSDAEMAALDIVGDVFHPEWNYTIKPRRRQTTQRLSLSASSGKGQVIP